MKLLTTTALAATFAVASTGAFACEWMATKQQTAEVATPVVVGSATTPATPVSEDTMSAAVIALEEVTEPSETPAEAE